MTLRNPRPLAGARAGALALFLALAAPLASQYREYYVTGQVLDSGGQPLAGVEVALFETEDSHEFAATTRPDGKFKFAGLPHGTYQVTVRKEGFETKTVEWNLSAPQEKMLRLEIPAIRLATRQEVLRSEQDQAVKKELDEAAERIRALDFDGALEVLGRAVTADPENTNVLYLTGLALAKKKRFPEARSALERVAAAAPDFAPARFQLGVCYQQSDEKEKALAEYREVMRLDADNLDAYFNATLVLIALNRPQEAVGYCEKVLQARPDDPDMNEMAGQCQLQLGNYPQALSFFEKAAATCRDEGKKKTMAELIAALKKTTGAK